MCLINVCGCAYNLGIEKRKKMFEAKCVVCGKVEEVTKSVYQMLSQGIGEQWCGKCADEMEEEMFSYLFQD